MITVPTASPRRPRPAAPALLLALAALLAAPGCARKNYGRADARPPAAATRPLPPGQDSVPGLAAGRHYNTRSWPLRLLLGRHYRRVWAAPVTAPVLRLATAAPDGGPLTPGKAGGGFQTAALTLADAAGHPYVLRGLDKDPRKVLPPWLRYTFVLNVVRDATSAANPYAALVVPPLAQAAGVPHAHPRLVYVRPDEAGLGELSPRFRGRLALLEEKYSGPHFRPALAPPGTTALVDGEHMLAAVYASPQARMAGPAFLRARLLDVLLGDWDRHEGQWSWAATPGPAPGTTRYVPVPKDRDQVFYRFNDGLLPWLAARPFIAGQFQTFKPRYGHVPSLVHQAQFIDERGLMALGRRDFLAAAARLQARLPDSVLARAVRCFPPAVYALEGPRTLAALRARRAALPAAALAYYRTLARRPALAGTQQPERFTLRQYADSVVVEIAALAPVAPAAAPAAPYFTRTFYPAETRCLTLLGLGGDDEFVVVPPPAGRPAPIGLRLRGGPGTNRLQAPPRARRVRFDNDPLPRWHGLPYERLNDD